MSFKKLYQNLKRLLQLILMILFSNALLAQEKVVVGTITDSDGLPLHGVTVLVKNTTTGTISDSQGNYNVSVGNEAVLVFSFIGYVATETAVENRSLINVILQTDIEQLGEVVITALGISRSTKALPSSITKIPGEMLNQARENNLGSSMQGLVAGVNVTKANTGPAGSSRVLIRGNKSFGGENQPLYVIDGIPIYNITMARVGEWGGVDSGDGLTSINPEDIESITVMKGAAAAALYGSRGGFGVINIETKRGTARKGIGIEFNSNYVFESVYNLADLQTEYGAGGLNSSDPADPASPRIYSKPVTQLQAYGWGASSSWGPKLDGTPVIQFDGISRPYSYAGDNWKRFYDTGHSWTNSIAFTGGNANQTFRLSFSDLRSSYIIPNSGFERTNAFFATNGKFGKKVTVDAKFMYSNEKMNNRTRLSDSPGNPVQTVWALPANINVDDLKGDPDKLGAVAPGVITPDLKSTGEEFQPANNAWLQNPWWCAYQYKNGNIRDRYIISTTLRYDIFTWLYIQGRIGMDFYTRNNNSLTPQGTGYLRGGDAYESEYNLREINQEWMIGFDKEFGKFRVNSFLGGNKMVTDLEIIAVNGSDFNIPFFTSVINTKSKGYAYQVEKRGINSLYGSAELSYGGYLFVTGTGRNDWFSVLNPDGNSAFYPSIGASFLFTDAIPNIPEVLSYGKVRAAWGQVATANEVPYATNLTYTLLGQGHMGIPMGTFNYESNIPNPNLYPALSNELEIGTELRFFKGRFGLEFTYYDQKTTNDILWTKVSVTSGYVNTTVNVGELSNKGVELLINAKPVSGNFTWDIALNLAKNKNKVIAISEGVNELFVEQPRTLTVAIRNIVGYPFGMITGYKQKRDENGNKVYDNYGQPVRSDRYEILGNGVADITGGLYNSLRYKGINLTLLLDFKFGGDIYSGTNVRLTQWGLHKQTLVNREGGMLVEGVTQTGTNTDGSPIYEPISMTLNQEQTQNYWINLGERCQENFIYDASFIKLRQVTLEYSLPVKLLGKTPFNALTLSFVGRNLAILYKNIDNVDPESNYSDSNGQGLDYFGMPGTRSYGFNLRVVF